MALLFCDSFDHAEPSTKWSTQLSSGWPTTTSSGRHSSNRVSVGNNTGAAKTLSPSSSSTGVCGFAFMYVNANGASVPLVGFFEGTSGHVSVSVNSDASLSVIRGGDTSNSAGTVLATTAAGVVSNSAWHYVELSCTIHDTTGAYDLQVDGVSLVSGTNVDTRNGGTGVWTRFVMISRGSQATYYLDDLYVSDQSGAAPWNTFLGDIRVDAGFPTAEGNSSAWTPLSGTDNALMVDETAPDGDTTYVSTDTVTNKDTYVVSDVVPTGAAVYGVQVNLHAKKSDAGTSTICPVVRNSTTDYDGTDIPLSTSYVTYSQMYQTNPGTAAQWTESEVDAAEFGVKRTA